MQRKYTINEIKATICMKLNILQFRNCNNFY